jgi:hypothetical protein
MSESLPTDKAKAGTMDGVKERMARFEASTAEVRDTTSEIKDAIIGMAAYFHRLDITPTNPDYDLNGTLSYAASLIAAAESDINKQDRDELAAVVNSPSLSRLNICHPRGSPASSRHSTSAQIQSDVVYSWFSNSDPRREHHFSPIKCWTIRSLSYNMPIRPMPPEAATVLSDSAHSRTSQMSVELRGPDNSMHSVARAHKASWDDELDTTTKINAIDESVIFLSNYIRDSDDPDIIVQYTNMMRDQWTR